MRDIIILGTDTGVGKTVAAALLCCMSGARYWKPVQCGTDATDSEEVHRLAGVPCMRETFSFSHPLSPHHAAALAGERITRKAILKDYRAMQDKQRPLLIETAGGCLSPLAPGYGCADLAADLGIAVLLVTQTTLGTISRSLLCVEAMQRRGLHDMALLFMGDAGASGPAEALRYIREQTGHPCLGVVPRLAPLTQRTLKAAAGRIDSAWLEKKAD